MKPRETPSRDEKYMGEAFFISGFSKDPNTQMGAVVVDSVLNIPLGNGYNGPPSPIDDNSISWARPDKYDFIKHAEENAVKHAMNRGYDVTGTTIYVTGMPCKSCMLFLVDHGIGRVIYYPYKSQDPSSTFHKNQEMWDRTREIAALGGVELQEFSGSLCWMPKWMDHLAKLGIFTDI